MNSQATSRHRIRRKWFYLLSGVVVVGCFTLGTLAFLAFPQSPLDYLNSEDIQSIQANVFEKGVRANDFQVLPKHYQSILDALSPSRRDRHPMNWQGLATFRVELHNGRQYAVEFYDTGDQTAAFSVDRVYYRGGAERTALDALRNAKRDASNAEQQNDRNKLE